MRQRQPDDPEVQDSQSFDWSVPHSKGPPTVLSDRSANTAETGDEHAVDQIDGDVFAPVHLAGIPGDSPAGDYEVLVEEEFFRG